MWRVLSGAGADLLACETVPSRIEARALLRLLSETPDARAWLSFSCRDEKRLADGSDLAEVVAEVEAAPGVVAVGVNCVAPERVAALIRRVRSATAKPIVVYPNSGEAWNARVKRWQGEDHRSELAEDADEWRALGARLIGGCCRTGPRDIRRLRERLLG